jgi:hypothetical protein
VRNLFRLAAPERALAAAAVLLVPAAALMGRALHVSRASRVTTALAAALPIGNVGAGRAAMIVNAASSLLRARCLTRAIVLHAVLERLGVESQVVIGASFRDGEFRSHAWVEREGKSVLESTAGWTAVWKSST